jgi:hypothetical protein
MTVLTTEGFRAALQARHGQRLRVSGHVAAFGGTRAAHVRTMKLVDVRTVGDEPLANHVWVPVISDPEWAQGLRVGDIVSLQATINTYVKGGYGAPHARLDFALSDVGDVEIMKAG